MLSLSHKYQNSLTEAAKSINNMNGPIGIDLSGYLIEELRNDSNFKDFKKDIANADIFVASLIFIEDSCSKSG